ncbi:MAG: hemolysin family protein [Spirochaetes bacterium]|nr:hemolysin family protein [Spirochaetota bacterium]
MDPDSLYGLLAIILCIVLGTYFSAAETAFSALNRIRMKNLAEGGSKRAELVLRLHDKFDSLLSTLLISNNLVTMAAATISAVLFIRYFGEEIGPALSTVTLTVVVVFLGDITPKSLAKEAPERYALACAPLLLFFLKLLAPANWLFGKWKAFLGRIIKTSADDRMTEDELYSIVEEAQNDGVLSEDGKQLLDAAIEFNDRKAIDILTPRIDVIGISHGSSDDEIMKTFLEAEFSRLPVYRDSIDNIIGVVHMRDFFKYRQKENAALDGIFFPPIFVAPTTKVSDLFKQLQTRKSHFAVVADEYGGTAGIVTMEDILEELVGDIWDESDEVIVEFAPLDERRHKVICSAYLKDMFDYFGMSGTEAESASVSGWIMDKLGKVPQEGDSFVFEKLSVRVQKTQHRRALECIITVEEEAPETAGTSGKTD